MDIGTAPPNPVLALDGMLGNSRAKILADRHIRLDFDRSGIGTLSCLRTL
ncbi:hypothetical protein OH799_30790 [Nocardia sp. NBC_00881]|nr:hypothetical protein OH799_30790 [Nocardia sp. NBC_00881]